MPSEKENLMNQLETERLEAASEAEARDAAPEAHAPKKNSKLLFILGGVALLVILGVIGYYRYYGDQESTDDAQVDASLALIAPRIGGNVSEILALDNQVVKAGDPLIRLDPRDLEARVAEMRAELVSAQSRAKAAGATVPLTAETTTSGMSSAEAGLLGAQADLERANADYQRDSISALAEAQATIDARRATYDRAQADLTRMKTLADKDEISHQQLDSYTAAARVAESEWNATKEQLASVTKQAEASKAAIAAAQARVSAAQAAVAESHANRKQVAVSEARAGSAQADIAEAQAKLSAAELNLSYTTIVAPVNGRVTRKNVQLGQTVAVGQTLLTIVPTDVFVTANFKETQLAKVHPGQRADIELDMYGRSFRGHVDSIASATGSRMSVLPPENATGNFVKIVQRIPVKILIDEHPDGIEFRPGENASVTIFTK